VDFMETLVVVHRGRCDGICTTEEMGGFNHPSSDQEQSAPRHDINKKLEAVPL
jgi:hypothetical protein